MKGVEKVDSNQTVRDIGANLPGIKEDGETDQHSPYFCRKLEKLSENLSSAAFVIGVLRIKF